jgi:hypothetical protein
LKQANPNLILALDPSGSFYEGKGITGWCLFDKDTMQVKETGLIKSEVYPDAMTYYAAHIELLEYAAMICPKDKVLHIVFEDYLLYANKAEAQINSRMETSQLLGILKYICWLRGYYYYTQPASLVKTRWENKVLVHKAYIKQKGRGWVLRGQDFYLSRHVLDAMRHAIHYATFYERKAI